MVTLRSTHVVHCIVGLSATMPKRKMSYSKLQDRFDNSKHLPLFDWTEFDSCLKSQGKQGIIGLLKVKQHIKPGARVFHKNKKKPGTIVSFDYTSNSFDVQLDDDDSIISTLSEYVEFLSPPNDVLGMYIFKMSQYTNHLAYHEMTIMKGLARISTYCPHFCKGIGVVKTLVEPKFRQASNPFKIVSKYGIEKEVLLCEHIDKSAKFYNYIRTPSIHEDVLYSIVKQTLLAVSIAQNEKKFTHYDLHSNNIMVKKCSKDLVILYRLDEYNQFAVPTLGYYGVIIDFGFSYIEDLEGAPMFSSLCHTDVGFTMNRFDAVSDPKLFLVTVSTEIKQERHTKRSRTFRRVVKNIYSCLKIDWDSGWDVIEDRGAVDFVISKLATYNTTSRLFDKCDYYCFDIIQTLIVLPLEKQDYTNIDVAFSAFLVEWVKIENEIGDEFYNLYILKELIDAGRESRHKYMSRGTRDKSVDEFKKRVYYVLSKVSKFCNPKGIHFEKLLCSLFVLAKNIEGMLYDIMQGQNNRKQVYYDKMMLTSPEQIFAAINVSLPDSYVYNENTTILVVDNVLKTNVIAKLPADEIENINKLSQLARGTFINDLLLHKGSTKK